MFTKKQITINKDYLKVGDIVFATLSGENPKFLLATEVLSDYAVFVNTKNIDEEYVIEANKFERLGSKITKCDIIATQNNPSHQKDLKAPQRETKPLEKNNKKDVKKSDIYHFACNQDRDTFEKVISALGKGDQNLEDILNQALSNNKCVVAHADDIQKLMQQTKR